MAGLLVVRSRKMRVERQKAQVPDGTPTWKQKHWGLRMVLGSRDPGGEGWGSFSTDDIGF